MLLINKVVTLKDRLTAPPVNDPPAFYGHQAVVPGEIVGNLPIIAHVHHRQIGLFSGFERSEAVGAAQGIGGVKGGGSNRLSGRKAHRCAG